MPKPREILQQMENFLATQGEKYEQVLALSQKQADFIAQKDTAELLAILSQKQVLMGELAKVSEASGDLLQRWEACKGTLSEAERAPVETAHEQVKAILGKILEIEESGREALLSGSSEKSKRITKIQKGKQMLKAYGANKPASGGRFTDKTK
ncbi:MAG: flagellar export chaperone FlgN [Planctomycetes bacterium]|nr:flagellar export chaperone FlgN [Planctomycetota bacterium]